jgi:hypothetical protein
MLSSHFAAREVFGDHPIRDRQLYLARRLALDLLEPMRHELGVPFYITDGVRDKHDHNRLVNLGLSPSPTSDHSFGLDWQPEGVGAVDVIAVRKTRSGHWAREAFREEHYHAIVAKMAIDENDPPWGQFIWYRERGHFHIANRRDVFYSAAAIQALPFRKYKARTYIKE